MLKVLHVFALGVVVLGCDKKSAATSEISAAASASGTSLSATTPAGTIQITGTPQGGSVQAAPAPQAPQPAAAAAQGATLEKAAAPVGAGKTAAELKPRGASAVTAGGVKVTNDGKGGGTVSVPGVGTIQH